MAETTSYPIELIERVCELVDRPSDLLALCQVSKTFYDVVLPNHLYYRQIRCDLRGKRFWRVLLINRQLICRIRCLEISSMKSQHDDSIIALTLPGYDSGMDDRSDGEDSEGDTDEVDDNGADVHDEDHDDNDTDEYEIISRPKTHPQRMRALAEAISCMSSLERFHWHALVRPTNEVFFSLFENCPKLADVEVLDSDGTRFLRRAFDINHRKLWTFSNLTRFSYSEDYRDQENGYLTYAGLLANSLLHCPGLEDLQLCLYVAWAERPILDDDPLVVMFEKAAWPKLKRLSIQGSYIAPHHTTFFSNHPTIEAMSIFEGGQRSLVNFTCLPRLRSLEVDWILMALAIDSSIASNITHLDIQLSEDDGIDGERTQDSVLSLAKSLRSLIIRSYPLDRNQVEELLRSVPVTLERMAFLVDYEHIWGIHNRPKHRQWFEKILRHFPDLTHFSPAFIELWLPAGAPQISRTGPLNSFNCQWPDIDQALSELAKLAPSLRFVGMKLLEDQWDGNYKPQWVMLERDESGAFIGSIKCESMSLCKDIDIESWGNIYRGAGEMIMHSSNFLVYD